ncbi:MAG: hypothetical protein NTY09_03300, partial [bacterium]|nr:hypothetical protein [bacterium]
TSKGITTLSDNSTVVTGWFYGTATFGPGESNQTVLTSAGGADIFIARYNPDNTLAWAKRAGGPSGFDGGNGITTLSDNSTVVTGTFYLSSTFGPGESNQTVLSFTGEYDIFIACYNPDGTLAWAKCAGGTWKVLWIGHIRTGCNPDFRWSSRYLHRELQPGRHTRLGETRWRSY